MLLTRIEKHPLQTLPLQQHTHTHTFILIIAAIHDKCKRDASDREQSTEMLCKPTLWAKNTSHISTYMEHNFMFVKFEKCSLGTWVKTSAMISALVFKNESACKLHSTQGNISC
jgi:hypothetical protein